MALRRSSPCTKSQSLRPMRTLRAASWRTLRGHVIDGKNIIPISNRSIESESIAGHGEWLMSTSGGEAHE